RPYEAPPLQGGGWGGGHRPCARPMAPAPLRLGSKLPSPRCPSPEGEGLSPSMTALGRFRSILSRRHVQPALHARPGEACVEPARDMREAVEADDLARLV